MPQEHKNDFKLGIFLIAGLLVLVFALYMIGKDQSLFAGSFELKARFRDAAGLTAGNNVRYSGIQNGTVKSVRILDDTTIEVIMLVDRDARAHIRKSSTASIGSEGLMGNKVINILPGNPASPLAEEHDILPTSVYGNLNAAMGTLSRTNENAAIVAEELVHTVRQINNSPMLKRLLNDSTLPDNINATLTNIRTASSRINAAAGILETSLADVRKGKGTVGLLMADGGSRQQMETAIQHIHSASLEANAFVARLDSIAQGLQAEIKGNSGVMQVMLRDTMLMAQLGRSMVSIEQGTAAFNQNMEALKHNFLTRGYFRRLERKNKAGK